jgi:two-component system, chemotaxis family, sensor kinase Cph1
LVPAQPGETVWALDHLPAPLREALGPGPHGVAGVLCVTLRARHLEERLLSLYLFRSEEATDIAWAGNPEKPLEASPDGLRLSPRHSFDRWVEVRHGYSRPWDEETLFAAQQLREQLLGWV